LYLFLHKPFSCTTPKMHLSILLSNTLNNLSSVFDSVQVSDAHVSNYSLPQLWIHNTCSTNECSVYIITIFSPGSSWNRDKSRAFKLAL
jgi:hypothetical protein